MKKFLFLSLVVFSISFVCLPLEVMAQTDKKEIKIETKNEKLPQVFKRLEKMTGYKILFTYDDLRKFGVTGTVKAKNIEQAIKIIIGNKPLEYTIEGQYIYITLKENSQKIAKAVVKPETVDNTVTFQGIVVDTDREPLPGVSVAVKGEQLGTITNENGSFSLKLNRNVTSELVFSFIGMESETLAVRKSEDTHGVTIVMKEKRESINEVVITGVYQRKKESYTGSAATFNSKELKQVGSQGILQSLRTLDPSFKIADNVLAGSDPNKMPDFEIRGKSSVIGLKEEYGVDPNQPLFILDGFETTLETVMNLNMNRVANVTILKDAASTAIYGSKASNGVVVIETKVPAHGRLQLSYKGDYSVTMADLSDYNLMNSSEKLQFETLAGVYSDHTGDMMNQIRLDNLRNARLKGIAEGIDTYWLSEPLRTGFSHKHNLYAEGGEEKIRYGIGLSYGNIEGVMKGSGRETISGNLDLIYRTGKFQFSNKLTVNYLDTENPTVSFSEYALANPYYKKYNSTGGIDKYLYYNYDDETGYTESVGNPLWNAHLNNYDKSDQFGFTDNFIMEWFVTKDFRMRGKFGITHSRTTDDVRVSPLHTDFEDVEDTKKGLYSHSLTKYTVYEGDLSATYGHLFNEKHMVNAVAGFNFNTYKNIVNGYKANGFTDDQFGAPSFANGYPDGGKSKYSENETRSASFFLNAGYAYDNRFLVDLNYRLDGASMFGTNNRFRNTWSLGLGWNIHKEAFMQNQNFFQILKIRGSVGNPGNQNFAAYQAFSTYMFNGWMTNIFGAGVILNQLGNKNLAWQETINYNMGADLTFWENRVNVIFDYFMKVTDPLLAVITTPGSMGITSLAMNAGQQKTNGVELTLKVSPIYKPEERINWNISLNGSHAKSRYDKIGNDFSSLNNEGKVSLSGTTRYYDGGSPTAIWGVRSAGIDPATGKELFIKKDGTYTFIYDTDDEVVLGDTEPDFEGVIGTTLYYKGFSFGAHLRYSIGRQIFNSALFQKVENISTADIYNNLDKRALYDRWSPSNTEALYKGISLVQKTDKSSRFVMDDNFITGESFNVGYEFTQSFVRRMGLSALTVQANMNDVFRSSTVKQERGIDYPFARTVSLSLAATF